ncbi:MAG TPA: non-homologous end-joining DNA ligase [Myxococcales bacterium]|nr:non-homologous end-joining DNA ligase [Myxococcales bacterium]
MSGPHVQIESAGRELRVSNLDRVLWPAVGFTKRDLLAYYETVAPALLPHLSGRPVTLARFPEGVESAGWYQTNCPAGQPAWLRVARVAGRSGQTLRYCLIDETAALLWAANLGTIEFHPFLAAADRPDAPLWLVFDLDPGLPARLSECCFVALRLRERLERDGLPALAKTSGAKGLHVLVRLDGSWTFAKSKALAHTVAKEMAQAHPLLVTDRMVRAERPGKVFIDWGQNDPNKSTIAPYSLRATRWPGVSMPLLWEEVERVATGGDESTVRFGPIDVLARLDRFGDLLVTLSA